ncbi:MAG: prolipoprotein diacylglyceryl transferase [Desulfobacteraceae bacterium]|nr:prolipoprotein diacylglyceryl transferase [Desulfobacteraceae bacterium]
MIPYPNINPDLFTIGPIRVRWYGVMYVLGFVASYFLIQKQERAKQIGLVGTVAQDLVFYLAIGLVVGGRLGYILFYEYNDLMPYIENPLEIIATWHGGMSFHGGLIGCLFASWIFSKRRKMPMAALADCTIVTAPIGLGLGRLGNFINAELLGRPSDLPWAMIFPGGGPVPRHPTQLYEALAEGAILFCLLWYLRKKPFRDGTMIVFFLLFYGIFRFIIEFFKEPDPQIGFLLTYLTMGQILCILMILAAGLLALYLYRYRGRSAPTT